MPEAFNLIEEAGQITIIKDGKEVNMFEPEVLCYPTSPKYFEIIDCNDRSMVFHTEDLVEINDNRLIFRDGTEIVTV